MDMQPMTLPCRYTMTLVVAVALCVTASCSRNEKAKHSALAQFGIELDVLDGVPTRLIFKHGCPSSRTITENLQAELKGKSVEYVQILGGTLDATRASIILNVARPKVMMINGVQIQGRFDPNPGQSASNLSFLDMSGSVFSDPDKCDLSRLESLRTLSLRGTNIYNSSVERLSLIEHLEHIDIAETASDNACIHSLSKISQLKIVNISNTLVDGMGAAELRSLKPAAQVIWY